MTLSRLLLERRIRSVIKISPISPRTCGVVFSSVDRCEVGRFASSVVCFLKAFLGCRNLLMRSSELQLD